MAEWEASLEQRARPGVSAEALASRGKAQVGENQVIIFFLHRTSSSLTHLDLLLITSCLYPLSKNQGSWLCLRAGGWVGGRGCLCVCVQATLFCPGGPIVL